MCKGLDYIHNCGNCAFATEAENSEHCGQCLMQEMETKIPYQGWQPKTT